MNQPFYALLAASSLVAALAIGACGGDSLPSDTQSTASSSSSAATTTTGDTSSSSGGGMGGAGGSGGASGASDCFTNPMTHVEIINACTTADQVDKTPNLPLLGPSGELPPLP